MVHQISYFSLNVCLQNYISQRLRKWLQSFDNRLSLSDFSCLSSGDLLLSLFYMKVNITTDSEEFPICSGHFLKLFFIYFSGHLFFAFSSLFLDFSRAE